MPSPDKARRFGPNLHRPTPRPGQRCIRSRLARCGAGVVVDVLVMLVYSIAVASMAPATLAKRRGSQQGGRTYLDQQNTEPHLRRGGSRGGNVRGEPIRHTTTKLFNDFRLPQYENQQNRPRNAPYQDASNVNAIHDV
jgi:hypothetical protein